MDIVDGCDVIDDHHRGLGNRRLHRGLSFPKFRQHGRIAISVTEWRDLNVVKGKVPLSPKFPPALNESLFLFQIQHPFVVVGFTLVPYRAADRKTDDRMDHPVVEHRWVLIAAKRSQLARIRWAWSQQLAPIPLCFGFDQPILKGLDMLRQSLLVLVRSWCSPNDRLIDTLELFYPLESNRGDPRFDAGTTPG